QHDVGQENSDREDPSSFFQHADECPRPPERARSVKSNELPEDLPQKIPSPNTFLTSPPNRRCSVCYRIIRHSRAFRRYNRYNRATLSKATPSLRRWDLFAHFTDEQIDRLESCTVRSQAASGTTLLHEGETTADAVPIHAVCR